MMLRSSVASCYSLYMTKNEAIKALFDEAVYGMEWIEAERGDARKFDQMVADGDPSAVRLAEAMAALA